MLCSIDDYYLADGTLDGGWSLSDLRYRTTRLFDKAVPVQNQHGGTTIFSRTLIVGQLYEIVAYQTGDDFTNVGGTNTTGSIFIASGELPASWAQGSIVNQLGPVMLDRNKRRVEISFSIHRVHDSIKDCEAYILDHDETIPRTGDAKLIVSVGGIVTSSPYALIINGALVSHQLIQQYGKYSHHSYQIVGAPLFPVTEPTHITTEGGDRITTETGDTLIIE